VSRSVQTRLQETSIPHLRDPKYRDPKNPETFNSFDCKTGMGSLIDTQAPFPYNRAI